MFRNPDPLSPYLMTELFRFCIVVMLTTNTGLSILIREGNQFAVPKIESSKPSTQRLVCTWTESALQEAKEAPQQMDPRDDVSFPRKFWTPLKS